MLACCLETSTIHNNVIAGISSNLIQLQFKSNGFQISASVTTQPVFLSFLLVIYDEVTPVLAKMPAKSCLLDPVPTRLICKVLILVVCSLGNASFQHSLVPIVWQRKVTKHHSLWLSIKKLISISSVDPDDFQPSVSKLGPGLWHDMLVYQLT